MTRSFMLKTDRVEIVEAFARKEVPGVSISFPSPRQRKPITRDTKRVTTYDSVENILEFIVSAAYDVDVALFAAWLYDIVQKSGSKKTTVNGQQLTGPIAQVTVIIQNNIQVNQIVSIQDKDRTPVGSSERDVP